MIRKFLNVWKNYKQVQKDLEANRFGVFDANIIAYWNSLSFWKQLRLAHASVKSSNQLIFSIFEMPQIEGFCDFARFHRLHNVLDKKVKRIVEHYEDTSRNI